MTDIYETPITEAAGLRYKIQFRQVSGVWQQRHIWYPSKTPAYPNANDYRVDPWIRSLQSGPPPHAYCVKPAEEPEDAYESDLANIMPWTTP